MSILRCEESSAKRRRDFGVPRREDVAACARLLDRAIRTLRALPDRERPRDLKNGWPDVVRDARDAYGYTEASAPRFTPTPHDVEIYLDVLGWLTWLEQQNDGKRDAKVIVARACGFPWWAIGARFGRDPRTIQRWYDGAVTRVYSAFQAEVILLSR